MKNYVLPIVLSAIPAYAAALDTANGRVTDDNGEPLAGAIVNVKGSKVNAATDINGYFTLTLPDGLSKIHVTYIGMQAADAEAGHDMKVTLSPDSHRLDDVVVIAYGRSAKANVSSSISSVKGKDLEFTPAASLENAMQGRLAGVQVTSATGAPGGAVQVSVRGTGSFSAGNQPLYVVDGLPVIFDDITQKGGYQGNSISGIVDINPADIESIEVLKDASASALYGSRATNGVILITTKKGHASRTKVSFSGYVGRQELPRRLATLGAAKHIAARNEAIDNYNTSLGVSAGEAGFLPHVTAAHDGADTDWVDLLTRDALTGSAQLSVTGGNETTRFFISGGYFTQDGVLKGTDYRRLNLRSNISHDISRTTGIEANIALSSSTNTRSTGDNNIYSPWQAARKASPDYLPYNADGSYANVNPGTYNPVQLYEEDAEQNGRKYRAIANLKGFWNIIDGLTYNLNLGGDYNILHERGVFPETSIQGAASKGQVSDYRGFTFTNLMEHTLSYSRKWSGVELNALLGYSYQHTKVDNNYVSGINFLSPKLSYIVSAGEINGGSSTLSENALQSVFGRVGTVVKGRYIAELSLRADASSKFAPGKRTGYFPAASAAWRISEEPFFRNAGTAITELKLRASAGYTGNQEGIGNYSYHTVYSANGAYGDRPGLTFTYSKPNPDLTWEKAFQWGAGIDIALLNGRFDISADYYRKDTRDLLITHDINSLDGYSTRTSNIGSITNSGIDLTVTSHNFNSGGFKWDTSLNFSFSRNRVTGLNKTAAGDNAVITTGFCNILQTGHPFASFYLIRAEGLWQSKEEILAAPGGADMWNRGIRPGDVRYHDKDGNGIINGDDREIVGSPFPTVFGSLLNTLSWRGFDLAIDLQYSLGGKIYAGWKHGTNGMSNGGGNPNGYAIFKDDWEKRWTPAHTDTDVPRAVAGPGEAYSNNMLQYTTRFLENGDFLRIRNITVGYTVPAAVSRRFSVERLRVYFTVTNLHTFTGYDGYDPEVAVFPTRYDYRGYDMGSVPQPRTFTFGINLSI